MRILQQLSLAFCLLLCGITASSQQLRLGKNSSNLQKSAILELESDNQGMLLTRISDTTLINSLAPPDGMIIFFTPTKKLLLRTNGYWEQLTGSGVLRNYWSTTGNANGAIAKFGTTDNYDLPFITSNNERLRILANGNVGINTATATEKLDVNGNMVLRGAFMPGNSAGTSGQILKSNGAGSAPSWINYALSNLSDVSLSAPASGQILRFNGTSWVNFTPNYLTSIDTGNIAGFHLKVKSLFSGNGPVTYNATTGVIGITQATTSTNGYLSSTDWNTFNNKLSTIDTGNIASFHVKVKSLFSANGPLSYANGQFTISQASSTTNGYLSSADWNNFNNKLANIDTTNIANFHLKVKKQFSGGTGIGYNATTGVITNTGVISVNGNTGAVTVDTGYIANFHLKSKSLLNAGTGIAYNAISGAISNTGVTSVNGATGAVTIDTTLIVNFSQKVRAVLSGGTGISYNSSTGQIGNSGVTSVNGNTGALTVDTGYIANFHIKAKSLLSGTGPVTYNATTGAVGISQANTSTNGYLSSADWNTFNNKLSTIDTGNIASFHLKSKSLLSAGAGITYNPTTGVIASSFLPGNYWSTTGNSGMSNTSNFLGTTDDRLMNLKSNNYTMVEMGRRATLGLTQGYADYDNNDEMITHMRSAIQFYAPAAQFYKPKIFVDANGNFRTKGSSAGTDYFEFGATGSNNDGGFEFIVGDDGDEPIIFKSYDYVDGMSEIMRLQSGRMAIGSNSFNASNPEKLLVDAGTTSSYNLMTGKGSINNYLQINVQNQSAGTQASSDIVATSNNGDESSNYIDMGINGGGFTNTTMPMVSGANTAYLYSTGNDFSIGNGTANKNLRFFTGGYATSNERLRIDGTGNVGVATVAPAAKLDAAGTFKMGAKGSVEKNLISFEFSVASNTAVPALVIGALVSTLTPGTVDILYTLPAAVQPSSTRATVAVSLDSDLPAGCAIASARLVSTTQVKIRIVNSGTTAGTITTAMKFFVTMTEF
ncbi:MAG: hypothetical protein EOO09_11520 [Chitinophagaceae bacterium]|nr:MAG: hypothetical protein EOO09_11520 [Chitinophagaceae bacterium]